MLKPRSASTFQTVFMALRNSGEEPHGAEEEHDDADNGRQVLGTELVGVGQHRLHSLSAIRPYQLLDLAGELPGDGILPKENACNGDGNHQHGSQRKDRVISEGGPHALGVVIRPANPGILEKTDQVTHANHSENMNASWAPA